MQENSRMNFAKVLISTLIFAGSVHAQQDTRPVIPVEPVIARPLTSEEVKERRALMDTPSISQTYNTQFSGSMPIGSAPVALMPGEFLNKVAQTWEPTQSFSVKPKDSIMIPVGQGLMNTLSTNLIRVTAKSNDDTSAFEIDEGYLYVTVNTLNPISIILYEEGALDSQISVTLVPIPAPPTLVEIEFDLSDAIIAKAKLYREEEALRLKLQTQEFSNPANTPYQQKIVDLLLPVARGDIPRGFGLTPTIPEEYRYPCAMTVFHKAKQRLVGGKYIIDVVHVVNDSNQIYNIREEMCLARYVTAVALYQKAYLRPGDESEIYILRDKLAQEKETRRNLRPSLIGG
jgi:conjugal transfer pilus assembly protein TraK